MKTPEVSFAWIHCNLAQQTHDLTDPRSSAGKTAEAADNTSNAV